MWWWCVTVQRFTGPILLCAELRHRGAAMRPMPGGTPLAMTMTPPPGGRPPLGPGGTPVGEWRQMLNIITVCKHIMGEGPGQRQLDRTTVHSGPVVSDLVLLDISLCPMSLSLQNLSLSQLQGDHRRGQPPSSRGQCQEPPAPPSQV